MIDCHAHYYAPHFETFTDMPPELIVISVSETTNEAVQILELSRKMTFIQPSGGIHPEYISNLTLSQVDREMLEFDEFIKSHNKELICLGECGLDYSLNVIPKELTDEEKKSTKDIQQMVLRRHISYGKDYDLPLNVHSRNAGHYVIKELYESQSRALLHAFDGKVSYALQGVSHGLYFSIPPCIVRSDHFKKLAKQVPLDHLLLESDAPALGPILNEVNHPRNVLVSAQEIAKIKNISVDMVLQITTQNSHKLFKRLHYFSNTRL